MVTKITKDGSEYLNCAVSLDRGTDGGEHILCCGGEQEKGRGEIEPPGWFCVGCSPESSEEILINQFPSQRLQVRRFAVGFRRSPLHRGSDVFRASLKPLHYTIHVAGRTSVCSPLAKTFGFWMHFLASPVICSRSHPKLENGVKSKGSGRGAERGSGTLTVSEFL